MVPYYLLIAFPFLLSVVQFQSRAKQITEKSKNYPVLLFFLLYFLLLVCRDMLVGSDTATYASVFQNISNTAWSDLYEYKDSELGYTVLNKLVSTIGLNYRGFLFIASAIIVIPMAKLYYDFSDNSMVSIGLFMVLPVFLMNFSGLRQALAETMGIMAFYATKEKKPLWFLFWVLIAFSFHQSAFVLLIMYPLYHLKLRPVHLVPIIPLFAVSYVARSQIYSVILPLLGDKYAERYGETSETGAVTMLVLFLIFLLYSFMVPLEKDVDDVTRGLRNLLVAAVFIQMFSTISPITMRMNYYYLLFLPVLIPRITARWSRTDDFVRSVANIVMIAFFLVYYIVKANSVDSLHIYPYIPYWQGGGF